MTVKLNQRAYEHAKRFIEDGNFIYDERDTWAEHHPSTRTENEFIAKNGFAEYGKWFLGINEDYPDDKTRHYEFPYGDFVNVHRCGIIAAKSRAGQEKYVDIENAAAELLAAIENQARNEKAK